MGDHSSANEVELAHPLAEIDAIAFDDSGWDWFAFHARGLQLSHRLKEEAGDAYRVIYDKPYEDPNQRIVQHLAEWYWGVR